MNTKLQHLKRLRWGVSAAVLVGIGGSVAMNVLHAPDNPVARGIAATPSLALFVSIELISRIPSSARSLSAGRIAGTLTVAVVSFAISYWQQRAAVQSYGFPAWEATLWPLSVDGLMIVATLSLVEVVRKIRQVETMQVPVVVPDVVPDMTRLPQAPASGIPMHVEDPATLAFREAMKRKRVTTRTA